MKVKFAIQNGIKIIQQVGEFELQGVYHLIGGYHSGKMIKLDHISVNKQVMIAGQRHRQISGTLVGETTKINAILADLQVSVIE